MLIDEMNNLKNATAQEKAVITFILNTPNFVPNCNAATLAKAAYVSPATVTRLCQKLGMKGFSDFRLRYVAEQKASEKQFYADLNRPLVQKGVVPSDMRTVMPQFYNRVVYETNQLLDVAKLAAVKRRILQAKCLDFYATGSNYAIIQCAAFHFETLGISSHVYNEGNIHLLERLNAQSGHLSFLISHTGKNVSILKIARLLKTHSLPMIAITVPQDGELNHLADLSLELYSTPSVRNFSLLSWNISLNYIFDLIYAAVFSAESEGMFDGSSSEFYDKLAAKP